MKKLFFLLLFLCSLGGFSQSPKKFYKQAVKDIKAKNLKDAEFNLTEALRLKPNYYKYYLLRAQTREQLEKPQDALDDYMVCLAIKKHEEKLMMKAADINIQLQKYGEAITVLSNLLTEDEKNITAYSKKTWCLILVKQFKEAVRIADASLEKNYYNHLTHFYKAVALDSLGDYESALKDYTTAITLINNETAYEKNEGHTAANTIPKFKPYFSNIALVQHKLKKYDDALRNYTTAAAIDPKDAVEPKNYYIYYLRANSYLEKTEYGKSIDDLCKSLVINSDNKDAFLKRGTVYQLTKQFQSAISDYTKTIQFDNSDYAAVKGRAQCYLELGMLADAIADFSKAASLNPKDSEVTAALTATKKKLFEANRENGEPEIAITWPLAEASGFVNVYTVQQDIIVEGSVKDKSLLEKITVNSFPAFFQNEKNPSFKCKVPLENAAALEITATDVYGNTATKKLKIGRIVDDAKVKVDFSGKLLSDDGTNRPFANSTVYITNERGEILYTTKTDDKGKFVFKNLAYDKNYLLSMDAEDTPYKDVPNFRMVDENGNTVMKGKSAGKNKYKFEILPMDYTVMSLMTIDDAPVTLDLKGKLLADNDEKTPIGNIKFLLLNDRKEAASFTTTEADGKFTFANILPYDYEFTIDDIDSKKIPYEQIIVTDEKGRVLKQIKKDGEGKFHFRLLEQERNFISAVAMEAVDPWLSLDNLNKENNERTIIENIYYESGSFKILTDAEAVLKKTIAAMQKYPKLTLEVQSHTDAVAGDEYNMELSIKRANAVVDYLVIKGAIDKKRLSAKGFGETQLTNRCVNGIECSDAEHKQNRRTVFVLNYNDKLK